MARHSWELDDFNASESDDDLDWPDFSEADSDFDPTFVPQTPGDRFVENMLKMFDARTLNAKQLCSAMHLAHRAGIEEA